MTCCGRAKQRSTNHFSFAPITPAGVATNNIAAIPRISSCLPFPFCMTFFFLAEIVPPK